MTMHPIENVLPHTAPMILIDSLDKYDEDTGICSVMITSQSNFYNVDTQSVPSHVGIEYMAQTIAAYANANQLDNGSEVAIGFLVSSRKYQMHCTGFNLHSTLTIEVVKLYSEANGLSAFECVIKEGERVLVDAKINVFQPENPEQFLAEQL
ncbi:3-hydroxylacyl-ACP dehydratase [Pseudoalteromonas sp. KG3]|uniref:3-hydroxylacyl-ACP dehydratase n=1 Tax=Pseudoalteromonas prydzensis TaxID=182141 RepID=A0ABR9FL59_9GAMM|nr:MULTISPECIES: 3-hydroxylacyl-ACP dehydratase [Pseudoalteromonas]MBE0457532.1 3-hydroxylacyl-ACP dehydratase [Pseudoalteromonas prydzensis]WKD26131.1 3-hydroxylacyl-ACP dehydratase [Pseudoalteromonas sp. KG3]